MKIIARYKVSFVFGGWQKVWPQCSKLQIFLNQQGIKRFKLWISDNVADEKNRKMCSRNLCHRYKEIYKQRS